MKKIYTLLLLCSAVFGLAQVPQLINYQGVLRRTNGEPIPDTTIKLHFEIFQGSVSFYTEDQPGIMTNSLGLFSTQIGKVSTLPITWPTTPAVSYYLQVYMDGGTLIPLGGQQQIASVPFALNAPSPTVSIANNTLLTVGSSTAQLPATAGNQSLIALGGGSISISNGNTVTVWPTITGAGVATVTPTGNGYVVSAPHPSAAIQSAISTGSFPQWPVGQVIGIAQVVGSATGNSVVVAPDFYYNQNTGDLTLRSLGGTTMTALLGNGTTYSFGAAPGAYYSYSYNITPNLSMPLGNLILSSGPPTNTVDFRPYLPFRTNNAVTTTSLANTTGSVGIGVNLPQSELHVSGFTKLGALAPSVQMKTITGLTAASVNSSTTIALGTYSTVTGSVGLTTGQIISVSVLVQLSSGEWVHENSSAILNTFFDWHLGSNGTSIVISNLATSSAVLSRPVKITLTYTP